MTIRTRKGGVYDWEYGGPNQGTDSEIGTRILPENTLQTLKGALTADPRADSRGRRFIRLHGIGIGVIRKDKRCNGQELRLFAQFTASGREEKTTCKSIKECLAVAGTKL